jgi:hypothetical protein
MAATVLAVLVGACASSGNRTSIASDDCALRSQDSTFAAHIPLYRDCAVHRKARQLETGIHPEFRPGNASNGCYSAELEFVVSPAGSPDASTVRVVRTNTAEFADAALAVVPRLKYEPAQRSGSNVAQIVVEKFEMTTNGVAARCAQDDNPSPVTSTKASPS